MIRSLNVLDQADVDASVGKVRPMLTVVPDPVDGRHHEATGPSVSLLDELVREGARRMLAAALEAEIAAYVDAHTHEVDQNGRRLVVRNGHHAPRQVLTGAGA